MAEKEYIERDTIYRRVKERTNPYGKPTIDYESGVKVLNLIKQEPAADVVEVVRCKDCKHRRENEILATELSWCRRFAESVKPNDFCSYGERKEQ